MRKSLAMSIMLVAALLGWQGDMGMDNPATSPEDQARSSAVFAGGCFWCTESDFEKIPGVSEVISGYAGGQVENPTYEQSTTGTTGRTEAVKVIYDPVQVSYAQLVE